MLLMGLLGSERASLHVLEDMFNRKSFKTMFHPDPSGTLKYNSVSERLDVTDVGFFEKVYELFYAQLSRMYSQEELLYYARL